VLSATRRQLGLHRAKRDEVQVEAPGRSTAEYPLPVHLPSRNSWSLDIASLRSGDAVGETPRVP
jgi:hypothetical protein